MAMQENELYIQSRRRAFIDRLGLLPERCPLDVQVEEHFIGGGYIRERISYMTSPGTRVPAYVLIPRGLTRKAAAVVCIHQHNGEFHIGKSEPVGLVGNPHMYYALELCMRGYITITPDQEGFEERQATNDELNRWKSSTPYMIGEGAYEKFLAMCHLLRGSSLQARYVWDLACAVDYLYTRPDVEVTRIGALGHSLGGQEVCWLMLFDSRVKVGVCSCGIGTFESILHAGVNHNFAAYVPGLLQAGDMDQLVALLAPTPLFLSAGVKDWLFPIDGVRQIAESARMAYVQMNAEDAFLYHEFPDSHRFSPDMRIQAYQWLDRWLHETE